MLEDWAAVLQAQAFTGMLDSSSASTFGWTVAGINTSSPHV